MKTPITPPFLLETLEKSRFTRIIKVPLSQTRQAKQSTAWSIHLNRLFHRYNKKLCFFQGCLSLILLINLKILDRTIHIAGISSLSAVIRKPELCLGFHLDWLKQHPYSVKLPTRTIREGEKSVSTGLIVQLLTTLFNLTFRHQTSKHWGTIKSSVVFLWNRIFLRKAIIVEALWRERGG